MPTINALFEIRNNIDVDFECCFWVIFSEEITLKELWFMPEPHLHISEAIIQREVKIFFLRQDKTSPV